MKNYIWLLVFGLAVGGCSKSADTGCVSCGVADTGSVRFVARAYYNYYVTFNGVTASNWIKKPSRYPVGPSDCTTSCVNQECDTYSVVAGTYSYSITRMGSNHSDSVVQTGCVVVSSGGCRVIGVDR